eukprot:359747-Chlamydomonas_euryale.AAC.4
MAWRVTPSRANMATRQPWHGGAPLQRPIWRPASHSMAVHSFKGHTKAAIEVLAGPVQLLAAPWRPPLEANTQCVNAGVTMRGNRCTGLVLAMAKHSPCTGHGQTQPLYWPRPNTSKKSGDLVLAFKVSQGSRERTQSCGHRMFLKSESVRDPARGPNHAVTACVGSLEHKLLHNAWLTQAQVNGDLPTCMIKPEFPEGL